MQWNEVLFCHESRLFVCVEVLRPSQLQGVMSSTVVYLTTRLLGRQSSKRLTSIVHILSPATDNCPSWISGRERMTVENISRSISMKGCCWPWQGLNPRTPGLQSDCSSNWATEAGDESRFTLPMADGRERVYQHVGERFAISCVTEVDRFHCGSMMVWGGISHHGNTNLVVIRGNLTAQQYAGLPLTFRLRKSQTSYLGLPTPQICKSHRKI